MNNTLRYLTITVGTIIICIGCGGGGGGGNSSSTPQEPAPKIIQFSSDASTIFRGDSATLSFQFSDGVGTIAPNIGSVMSGGTYSVSPIKTTPYSLSVQSPGGVKVSQSLTIKAYLPSVATSSPVATHTRYGSVTESGGSVLIVGGVLYGGTNPDLVERWNPLTGGFSTVGNLLRLRAGASVSLLPSGKVLVVGGQFDSNAEQSMEIFDPGLGHSGSEITLPRPFKFHSATTLLDGRILLVGGQGSGSPFEYGSAYLFDPVSGILSPTGSLTHPRFAHVAQRLSDGRVVILGGAASGQNHPTDVEVYDPSTGLFSVIGQVSIPRYQFAAQLLSNGKILLAGGWGASGAALVMEMFDPATGSSAPSGSLKRGRVDLTLWLRSDGKLVIAGGFEPNSVNSLQALELWDVSAPSAGTQTYGVMLSTNAVGNPLVPITGSNALLLSGAESKAELLSSVPPEAL